MGGGDGKKFPGIGSRKKEGGGGLVVKDWKWGGEGGKDIGPLRRRFFLSFSYFFFLETQRLQGQVKKKQTNYMAGGAPMRKLL